MPTNFELILQQALELSPQERAALAERLWMSVNDSDEEAAWEAEIERRIAEHDAGVVEGIPAEKVMADLAARIAVGRPD